jgi:hypothetical protein
VIFYGGKAFAANNDAAKDFLSFRLDDALKTLGVMDAADGGDIDFGAIEEENVAALQDFGHGELQVSTFGAEAARGQSVEGCREAENKEF